MARLAKTAYPWPWYTRMLKHLELHKKGIYPEVDWKKEMDEESAALEALQKRSDKLKPGELVGGLLSFPAGDGSAYYLIVKEQPLTVQWVPYGDHWHVDGMLIRGMNRVDALRLIGRPKALQALLRNRASRKK